ncbi:MAG TPA: CoA-binding protein [Myxococcota bacterium]|nr:CoA-binding protein [Myxococcota bacterium]
MGTLEDPQELRRVLLTARRLAVLGAHSEPARAAFYVPDYLSRHGYTVIPVNPRLVGTTLFGEPVRSSLAEVGEVDAVVVFRRASELPGHLEEILSMAPPPRVVWLQLGIVHRGFTGALLAAGFEVVEDRCMLQDHRLLLADALPAELAR